MAVKRKYEKVKNEGKVARKVKPSLLKLKKNMDIESAVAQYSICIPTSAIDNCFNLEQTTFTAYQIAKTAVLFNIQEIIVLDLSKDRRHGKRPRSKETISDCLLLATLLQYFVTPSNLLDITFKRKNMLYLKHAFAFPKLHQLAFMNESAEHIYREGLSIAQDNAEKEIERDQTNLVYIGKGEIIELSNQNIPRTVRVTVDLQRKEVVSPRDVYKNQTLGYHVRVASTLDEVSEGYARTLWVNSGDYHYDEELSKYRKVETKLPYIMKIKKRLCVRNTVQHPAYLRQMGPFKALFQEIRLRMFCFASLLFWTTALPWYSTPGEASHPRRFTNSPHHAPALDHWK
ncbi:YGR283C-like protein [Saccharomyces cerevisiae x Saccharomyces kudriavzevii VIN7]|uniref:YGR283C-like protein n=1 Tax=Saccharomyces cerevisiae x Saccharomyces kudriavzevii (strain VIN7) TaxID=1095631 RepID=H0GVG9_SACCK|nr:YGR283C-like protein [Saccharomyces cerevisiae x Saccharomyces kudriavzevii VIN7]